MIDVAGMDMIGMLWAAAWVVVVVYWMLVKTERTES